MAVYLLFIIPPLLLGLWAQHWVKSSFAKWSQVSAGAVSGADVARRILAANGLQSIPGLGDTRRAVRPLRPP